MAVDATEGDRRTEFLRGTIDLCLLACLAERPDHAYRLVGRLSGLGLGPVSYGTVYPLLTRLRRSGLVQLQAQPGDGGPARKVYSLTSTGREALRLGTAQWRDLHAAADRFLPPTGTVTSSEDRAVAEVVAGDVR